MLEYVDIEVGSEQHGTTISSDILGLSIFFSGFSPFLDLSLGKAGRQFLDEVRTPFSAVFNPQEVQL